MVQLRVTKNIKFPPNLFCSLSSVSTALLPISFCKRKLMIIYIYKTLYVKGAEVRYLIVLSVSIHHTGYSDTWDACGTL